MLIDWNQMSLFIIELQHWQFRFILNKTLFYFMQEK
jgi:hypothetical protein